ncbi:hypothetical protein BA895_06900 [Humibacillus sp. DSM 29435]|uniref:hypothetical protein n=1 Tax=Humibacillus sp. DSM 29435 TaxID=1869167 RepID=UPI000872324C|nr:hypothetical protein [Humibacillus sp. DSM 29435]OFE15427.1 hypothetical protein BA895_06900 [Humibacillus sp. DSM 29435]
MGRVKRRVFGLTAVAALVLAGLGGPASAATTARHIAPPQLKIRDVGGPLRFGPATLTLSIRCFGGAILNELTVKVTQESLRGERYSGRTDDIVCDGVRRDISVASYSVEEEKFHVGPSMVTASLTVLDPQTMKPLPAVVATQSVYLRPYVFAKIATGPVRLTADGSAVFSASVKCLAPYVLDYFDVSAWQNGGRIGGYGPGDPQVPPCDGTFHERTFTVHPNKPFVPGVIHVTANAYLLDPDTHQWVDFSDRYSYRTAIAWGSVTSREPARMS